MDKVVFLNSINVEVPRVDIYRRLKFDNKTTKISDTQKKEIELYISEALALIKLKAAILRIKIDKNSGKEVFFSSKLVFKSKNIAYLLKNCQEVLVLGATCGQKIIDKIKSHVDNDNLVGGVVSDATASEMVDAALDWIVNYYNIELRRENKRLTSKRFSAGFGDFSLDNQEKIYNILQLNKLGIKINKRFILEPEKSVTAVAGIVNSY